ncbi:uncharacterized protein DFL_006148 [Arthrobotrys flagrans]|uniref:Uncharacterized protein n=1 Tax=Arthrobotrys flagrans TaxID=97331 RepID=A0A436ZZG5_ARTFL|nr:hypothetical protein DFL_006148 [Arthrobotrys flagrans]
MEEFQQHHQRDKDSEGYRPQINWQSPALDVRWVGFRPRLIDFEDECDFELAGTPTRRNIASRRSPWLSFPDQSPTRANSISSSIPSNDDDGDDDNDDTFELQHTTQSREAERQSGKLYPSPTQIGLRMFTGKKGVDAIFRPRITRNTSKPTVPARQSSNPTESTAASGEYTHVSPGKKFKTSPQQTRSEAEKPRVHNTWQAAKATVHKQNFPAKFRNICEWGRNNNSAVLLILLSWFTMFILAQTRILRIDTWEFLNPELKRKNQKVYPSTDARIIYHLESIEERQGRLHDKVQRQLNGNAIVLDFMLQEMQNLKSAFSAVADRRQMERQIDKLKGDIKRCNEDMLSRTTRKPIIIKQRPTYTVTKMTKTIIRQHYRTSRPRPTVYNKVLFYPNDSIKQQKTNQPGRLDATSPILTDKDVDRIAQKLAKSVNISSKDINPGGPWWNVFPSFSGVGKGTERLLTKRLELIIQLLCLEESGLLADSFASRIRKCLKSRRELVSILHFRTQSTIPNRILSTTAKFSDDLPPAGFSIVCGAVILFYGSTFARWVGWYHGGVGRKRILRILAICMSVLSVIIWPTRLAALWIRHQEQFEPIRRLPWGARLLAEIRIYLVAALEKIPTWLPDSIQAGWESLDLIGRRKLRSGVYVNHGSKIQLFLQKAGSFGRYISIWSIKNIAWISVPYMVLECSVLLVIFAFVTRGLPAIRIGVEKIRHWTSRFQGNTLTVIKQVPDFWQSNRAFFTRGWILGLTQLLHILLKQFIISIRDSRSFQWAKEVAQQSGTDLCVENLGNYPKSGINNLEEFVMQVEAIGK